MALIDAELLTCRSMPITQPFLCGGPSDWQATCSHAPGEHPRSSICIPAVQLHTVSTWPIWVQIDSLHAKQQADAEQTQGPY